MKREAVMKTQIFDICPVPDSLLTISYKRPVSSLDPQVLEKLFSDKQLSTESIQTKLLCEVVSIYIERAGF